MKIALLKNNLINNNNRYEFLFEAETVQDGIELGKLCEIFYSNNIEYELNREFKTLFFKANLNGILNNKGQENE